MVEPVVEEARMGEGEGDFDGVEAADALRGAKASGEDSYGGASANRGIEGELAAAGDANPHKSLRFAVLDATTPVGDGDVVSGAGFA